MEQVITKDFGYSGQPVSLEEMIAEGIINDPEERYIVFIIGRKGKAQTHINLKRQTITQDSLVVLFPQYHLDISETNDFRCDFIYYTFDFMAELPFAIKPSTAEKISNKTRIQLDKEEIKNLDVFFNLVVQQYQRQEHPSRMEIVKSGLFMFIAEINMIYSQQVVNLTPTHPELLTKQFFTLLHDNHTQEHKPTFYANKMCLTVRYLSKVLKQVTGKSLNAWIIEFSIIAAKKLLKSTTLTSAQITEEMNFPNPSFFAKYFKKYTGMTPIQFRQLRQEAHN